jgi:hypothetical protein
MNAQAKSPIRSNQQFDSRLSPNSNASCKSADVSPRIVELDQWNTGSALNSRSPELWRKAGRRERFCYLSDVSQCAGRFVRAPIYWESTRLEATRRKLDGTAVAEGDEPETNILQVA